MAQQIQSESDGGRSTPTSTSNKSSSSSSLSTPSSSSPTSTEHETDAESDDELPYQPLHVLSLMQNDSIQFHTLRQNKRTWERSSTRVELTQSIESFRDAVMVPLNNEIVIFYMKNGFISQAQRLAMETTTVQTITLPDDIGCANLALFCRLNDTIYCFARSNQHVFHR